MIPSAKYASTGHCSRHARMAIETLSQTKTNINSDLKARKKALESEIAATEREMRRNTRRINDQIKGLRADETAVTSLRVGTYSYDGAAITVVDEEGSSRSFPSWKAAADSFSDQKLKIYPSDNGVLHATPMSDRSTLTRDQKVLVDETVDSLIYEGDQFSLGVQNRLEAAETYAEKLDAIKAAKHDRPSAASEETWALMLQTEAL